MRRINCVIVEDEVPSQKVLIDYIGRLPHLEISGIFSNPLEAIELIQSQNIDLLFLDISLPQMTGIDFLKSFKMMPKVIITSGSGDYALESYEFEVLDYLLKPFSFNRFVSAVSRFPRLSEGHQNEHSASSGENFIFVKDGKNHIKMITRDILYIGAEKDYSKIVIGDRSHLILKPMSQWESDLSNQLFSRIHKSYIVNLVHIDRINKNHIMIGDKRIPIGRNYKIGFQKAVQKYNL